MSEIIKYKGRPCSNSTSPLIWLLALAGSVLLAACSGSAKANNAAAAVQAYEQALVSKDADMLSNLSCAAWEADAKTELDSFAAVSVKLVEPNCQESGTDGDYTLVSCSGKIVANYNGENLEINLGDRIYKAIQEDGEWRMCGYR
jgi:outer membrane murein-binding lipoprotein Lpp